MKNIQGKVWGNTEPLFCKNNVEFHRIETNKGGYCSKHCHEHKFNAFYVESGSVKIKVWKNEYDLVDETVITKGQMTTVKPGEYHLFESLEDSVVYEIYWVELSTTDIVRENVGGNGPDAGHVHATVVTSDKILSTEDVERVGNSLTDFPLISSTSVATSSCILPTSDRWIDFREQSRESFEDWAKGKIIIAKGTHLNPTDFHHWLDRHDKNIFSSRDGQLWHFNVYDWQDVSW